MEICLTGIFANSKDMKIGMSTRTNATFFRTSNSSLDVDFTEGKSSKSQINSHQRLKRIRLDILYSRLKAMILTEVIEKTLLKL